MKIKLIALVLIVGILVGEAVTAQQNADNNNGDLLTKARAAYRQHDFVTAKRELQLALAARKDWPEAQLLGALIAWQENKRGDAIGYAKEAVRLQPIFPTAHYLLARLYFEAAKLNDAYGEVSLAMAQGQQFADIYVLLGDIEIMRHKSIEALEAYETALKQPAPKNELTQSFNKRLVAIRNMVEFIEHKNDPSYQRPVLDKKSMEATNARAFGRIDVAGVLNEQGTYEDIILLNADFGIRGRDQLIERVKQYKFTPALKNGKPVSFWLYFSYSSN